MTALQEAHAALTSADVSPNQDTEVTVAPVEIPGAELIPQNQDWQSFDDVNAFLTKVQQLHKQDNPTLDLLKNIDDRVTGETDASYNERTRQNRENVRQLLAALETAQTYIQNQVILSADNDALLLVAGDFVQKQNLDVSDSAARVIAAIAVKGEAIKFIPVITRLTDLLNPVMDILNKAFEGIPLTMDELIADYQDKGLGEAEAKVIAAKDIEIRELRQQMNDVLAVLQTLQPLVEAQATGTLLAVAGPEPSPTGTAGADVVAETAPNSPYHRQDLIDKLRELQGSEGKDWFSKKGFTTSIRRVNRTLGRMTLRWREEERARQVGQVSEFFKLAGLKAIQSERSLRNMVERYARDGFDSLGSAQQAELRMIAAFVAQQSGRTVRDEFQTTGDSRADQDKAKALNWAQKSTDSEIVTNYPRGKETRDAFALIDAVVAYFKDQPIYTLAFTQDGEPTQQQPPSTTNQGGQGVNRDAVPPVPSAPTTVTRPEKTPPPDTEEAAPTQQGLLTVLKPLLDADDETRGFDDLDAVLTDASIEASLADAAVIVVEQLLEQPALSSADIDVDDFREVLTLIKRGRESDLKLVQQLLQKIGLVSSAT